MSIRLIAEAEEHDSLDMCVVIDEIIERQRVAVLLWIERVLLASCSLKRLLQLIFVCPRLGVVIRRSDMLPAFLGNID
jgi:hypothetical protein